MIDPKACEHFLFDVGLHIKERALQAKAEREKIRGAEGFEFESGRVMGLGEAIAILQQTLEAFGIPVEAMQLEGIDSDRDLV